SPSTSSQSALNISGDRPSPVASATFQPPEQPEALAMPRDNGLRFHNDKGRSPTVPGTRQPSPEPPVPLSQDAAVAVGIVAAPAVDGAARGSRGAERYVSARVHGTSPERTSARTSSQPQP